MAASRIHRLAVLLVDLVCRRSGHEICFMIALMDWGKRSECGILAGSHWHLVQINDLLHTFDTGKRDNAYGNLETSRFRLESFSHAQ